MSAGISCLDQLYTLEVQFKRVEWFTTSLLFGYEEPSKCEPLCRVLHDNDIHLLRIFPRQRLVWWTEGLSWFGVEWLLHSLVSSRYIITVGLLLWIRHSGSRTFLVPSDCKYRRTNVNYSSFCQDAACSVCTTGSNHKTAWANWLNFEFKRYWYWYGLQEYTDKSKMCISNIVFMFWGWGFEMATFEVSQAHI